MPLWRRDAEIIELVNHFDRKERKKRWDLITPKESEIILRQLKRCREDFSYAARNYFWIVDKKGEDIPFGLWESQELILEKWYWLKKKYPNRAQRLMLLKARQLGCSTVIEGLIAWATIFFSNRNALVVSHNDTHAAYLYSIMLHIYDHLPWWLKPMLASRKQETGLVFANPSLDARDENPGNNSRVDVQSAAQLSGVGQGMKLNAVHASEYADWDWTKFKDIIDGDMTHAIADSDPNSFAFLESTGKGSGSPAEEMWLAQQKLLDRGDEPDWYPLFIPWFFETTRVWPPENGWSPQQPELDMQARVSREWVLCNNETCGQFLESQLQHESRVETPCPECQIGELRPVVLADPQLRFMQNRRVNAEEKGLDSLKRLREELATTAEEAFQLSGIQVFPPDAQEFVINCINRNPRIWGNIDRHGRVHYVKNPRESDQCAVEGCTANHRYDPEQQLQIWELPDPNARYCLGADVAEGLGGKSDFSVIFVNKYYENGRGPDEQVALWRSNTVDPIAFAGVINAIGRLYNGALAAVEVNKYDSCDMALRMHHLYPNCFIWKHYDSKNPMSNKLGWVTNLRSKPMLWQTAVRWLRGRMWIVRSDVFAHEMKRFQKDEYDDMTASAERNYHDDVIMAGMIALFCLAPETKVLTSDLRWVPIGDCSVGDRLIGFDEEIKCEQGIPSFLQETEITSHCVRQEERFEIVTDRGSVISSGHHGWVSVKYKSHSAKVRSWVTTDHLKPGDEILYFSRPWEQETSPESQWLAGFLDGEGCVNLGHQHLTKFGRNVGRGRISFAQNPGVALQKALSICEELGIGTTVRHNGTGRTRVVDMKVAGIQSALEIIGRVRPVRLLDNSRKLWDKRPFIGWHWPMPTAKIIEVRPLGVGPVVSMGTTTKTFFAEGFASHNCAHDMDYGDAMDFIPVMNDVSLVRAADWSNKCLRCNHSWITEDYPGKRCTKCRSMLVSCARNTDDGHKRTVDFADLGKSREQYEEEEGIERGDFDPPQDVFATS